MARIGWDDQLVIDAWVEFMRTNQNRSRRTLEATAWR